MGVVVAAVLLTACGGGDDAPAAVETSATTEPVETSVTSAPATTSAAPGTVTLIVGRDEPLNQAFDLVVSSAGDLYIANTNAAQLLRWDGVDMHVAYPGDFGEGENEFTGVATQSDGSVVFTTGLAEKWLRPDKTLTDLRIDDPGDQVLGLLLATGPRDEIYLAFGRLGKVDLLGTDGSLTPYAGSGQITTQPGVVGDGGPALNAQFSRISDFVVDRDGVMYLADEGQGVIRRVKPDGTIDTVIGLGADLACSTRRRHGCERHQARPRATRCHGRRRPATCS